MQHERNPTTDSKIYERLNPDELSQLCQPTESGQTLASTYTNSLRHIPSRYASKDPTVQTAFHTLYPGASDTDRENILLLDSLIAHHHYLAQDMPDTFRDIAHGTSIDHFLKQSHRTLPMTQRQIQQRFATDACRKRIEEGAPRTVQLACAAEALTYGRISSQRDYDTCIGAFILSGEDTADVITLCRAATTSLAPEQHVLSYAEPSHILRDDTTIDNRLIRSEAAYDLFATSFDRAIVSTFDNHPHMLAWERHNDRIGQGIIDDLLDNDARRIISLKSLADDPHLPNHLMAKYIEPSDVAQAAHEKIIANLSRDFSDPDSKAVHYWDHAVIAQSFRTDPTPFVLKQNRRYIELMKTTTDKNSELHQQAEQWIEKSDAIDPKIEELFRTYAHHHEKGAVGVYDIGIYGPSEYSTDRDEARRFDEWCTEIFSHREQFRQTCAQIQEYIASHE